MNTKVSQMTVEELREVIGTMVEEKLQALFADEQEDSELTDELKARLLRQATDVRNGERGAALEDVAARLGLN